MNLEENKKHASQVSESHIVPTLESPTRLQEYGVNIFEAFSTKSALKKILKKQYITVNNNIASTATIIRGGETISLNIPEAVSTKKKLNFPLAVLHEDEYLAVIHKPAGILVSGNRFKTIANALAQNLQRSPLPDAIEPQPAHRLDYATTGLLLVGKTASSLHALNTLFEDKKIEKNYLAITIGSMPSDGVINSEIDGKPSQSDFELLETVFSKRFRELNLVRIRPKTGRRHQIRKHLSQLGNPILGDKEYGQEPLILKGKGMYLHAASLQFIHPDTGEALHLHAEFPKRFRKIFNSFNETQLH